MSLVGGFNPATKVWELGNYEQYKRYFGYVSDDRSVTAHFVIAGSFREPTWVPQLLLPRYYPDIPQPMHLIGAWPDQPDDGQLLDAHDRVFPRTASLMHRPLLGFQMTVERVGDDFRDLQPF